MKIGIDIDNVISNFNDTIVEAYLQHDKQLRNTGIINDKAKVFRRGMFDLSEEEEKDFYYSNIEKWANAFKPINNAEYYIKKLKQDGNKIYIISGRKNGEYRNPYKLTEEWLEKYDIIYDKLILTNAYNKHEKAEICLENNIDIMIEDSIETCINLINEGIETYTMNTRFNIEAITVAPYHHDNGISIQEGLDKSYNEIIKICNWLNFNSKNKVFKGSTGYIEDGYSGNNDAVNKIIEIASKNTKTYILAIGAITNVAIALKKAHNIVDKIEVIWLGGHSLINKDNKEFNFKQDVQAVRTVLESKVNLTIIPCKNVASNLRTSIYELEHFLKGKSELCDYLCRRFYNDGIHGIKERRVIWDISVIAYMINKKWFETEEISCPNIKDDTSYELTESNHKIRVVNYLNVDKYTKIYLKN